MRDALLFKLKVEIGVGKTALAPVLVDDDVAFLRHKVRMPFSAPRPRCERVALLYQTLSRIRMIPVIVIAGLPAAMRYVEDLDIGFAGGIDGDAEIVEQSDVCGDVAQHREELAAVREKVVVGVDQQQASALRVIDRVGHFGTPVGKQVRASSRRAVGAGLLL